MKHSSRLSRRKPFLIGGAVLAAAAVGATVVFTGVASDVLSGDTRPPSSEGSTLAEADDREDTRHVVLLVDGWSERILSGTDLEYRALTPSAAGEEPEETSARLNFVPVSSADVGALAQDGPDLLERTAARMITVDPALSCTPESCSTADGDLPYTYFTDAASIPGYGPSYTGYDIDAALYKADLYLPEDVLDLTITAQGYASPFILNLPQEGSTVEVEGASGGVATGNGKDWFLMGAGLGRFFIPEAGWKDQDMADPASNPFITLPLASGEPTKDQLDALVAEPLAAKGLTTPVPATFGLGDQQMTYFTSPTTGCGVAVTCIPENVEVSFTDPEVSEVVKVCDIESGTKSYMVMHTSRWNLTYPSPTHQYGIWNGVVPEDFDGASDSASKGLFAGVPPLVSGQQEIRVSEIEIVNGSDARLWNLVAWVAQEGADRPEDFERTYDASSVTEVQDGRFKTC